MCHPDLSYCYSFPGLSLSFYQGPTCGEGRGPGDSLPGDSWDIHNQPWCFSRYKNQVFLRRWYFSPVVAQGRAISTMARTHLAVLQVPDQVTLGSEKSGYIDLDPCWIIAKGSLKKFEVQKDTFAKAAPARRRGINVMVLRVTKPAVWEFDNRWLLLFGCFCGRGWWGLMIWWYGDGCCVVY